MKSEVIESFPSPRWFSGDLSRVSLFTLLFRRRCSHRFAVFAFERIKSLDSGAEIPRHVDGSLDERRRVAMRPASLCLPNLIKRHKLSKIFSCVNDDRCVVPSTKPFPLFEVVSGIREFLSGQEFTVRSQ